MNSVLLMATLAIGGNPSAEDVALGYFYAWSRDNNAPKSCLSIAEDAILDSGLGILHGRAEYCALVSNGNPWKDVVQLSKTVTGDTVAIIYQGTDTVSLRTFRVAEFIDVKDGLISHIFSNFSDITKPNQGDSK